MDDKEIKDVKNEELDTVTKEINLDELYDGSVNNTVFMDPVSNDEILLSNKKNNYSFIIIIIIVLLLLVLYYITNNYDLKILKSRVKETTTIRETKSGRLEEETNNSLVCEYNSKSDSENQTVLYTATYTDSLIKESKFNYVVISNLDSKSETVENLTKEYQDFFANNKSDKVSFEANEKGFTFNVDTDYEKDDIDSIIIEDGKTSFYIKPSNNDNYTNMKEAYERKGFSCKITNSEDN